MVRPFVAPVSMVLEQFYAKCDCNYENPPPDNVLAIPPPDNDALWSPDGIGSGLGDTAGKATDQAIAYCSREPLAQYKPAASAENCQLFEKTSKKTIISLCKCKNSKSMEASGNTVDEAITAALKKAKVNPRCSQTTKSDCTVNQSVFYKKIKK